MSRIAGHVGATACSISKKPSGLLPSRPCSASATSCSTISSMATSRAFRRRRRRRCSPSGSSEVEIGGAGNVARNIAALGAHCIFVGLIGNDEAGRVLTDTLGKLGSITSRARWSTRRARPRARCASSPSITRPTCCAPIGKLRRRPARRAKRQSSPCAEAALPQSRRGGAVRLCQRRAHRARHSRRHRSGAPPRQTGRRRSERPRLPRLSRRDADHAERKELAAAVHRPVTQRGGDRRRCRRTRAACRQRSRAGHPQRRGHEPARRRSSRRSIFPPIRSRCAMFPAPATPSPR